MDFDRKMGIAGSSIAWGAAALDCGLELNMMCVPAGQPKNPHHHLVRIGVATIMRAATTAAATTTTIIAITIITVDVHVEIGKNILEMLLMMLMRRRRRGMGRMRMRIMRPMVWTSMVALNDEEIASAYADNGGCGGEVDDGVDGRADQEW